MNKIQKLLQKIRLAEQKIPFANPAEAAKLTGKIVKWKGQVFDEDI